MIRLILFLLLTVLVGLLSGSFLAAQKGYLILVLENWTVQISFVKFCLLVFLAVITFLFLEWLVKKLLRILLGSRSWLISNTLNRQEKHFHQGLLYLAEGDYGKAKLALSKAGEDKHQGIALLAAAEAELQLGKIQQARELWLQASHHAKASLAAHTNLLRNYLYENQADLALSHVQQMPEKLQKNKNIIRLWANALALANNWQLLKEKLPGWKKPLGKDYDKLMQQAGKGTFAEIASREGANQLKQTWQTMPRAIRKDKAQQAAYVQQLIDQGMHLDAEIALVDFQKQPEPLLMPLFNQLRLTNPIASVKKLQHWIKQDDCNVSLLSALGHVAFYAKDYGLADNALSRAIKFGNRQQDILLMAELKELQQQDQQAIQLYKQSIGQD